ncbi:hypothetical protein DCM91_04015 [Chitinophaga costaii]|uniref:hypothetical protein n=1 Tax=Chitinophaga costaii TaxID=1335309 RepID=UPI000B7D2077|nr:hypothetical protein [Chitinophaga costaii]PUZ27402.1 hypothetical protein DCM91_04015 [Chitinophaga costaii]
MANPYYQLVLQPCYILAAISNGRPWRCSTPRQLPTGKTCSQKQKPPGRGLTNKKDRQQPTSLQYDIYFNLA